MADFFYTLIIYPIESILSIFFVLFMKVFNNEAVAIVGLSTLVTVLVLPLYNMADAWQDEEREKQRKMKSKLDDIKAAFRGDERHMITNTYYRQQHYHPLMQLRSVIGVAIQVPFFIAAYHYLSHLTVLNGVSFLFLKDLSKPDGLFQIGNFSINIMPILMTVINLMSAFVYANKLTRKELVQLALMALLFLVLLYTSPSGLVLYWTMNNVFSLIKNLIYRYPKVGNVLNKVGLVIAGLAFVYSMIFLVPGVKSVGLPMAGQNFKRKAVLLLLTGVCFGLFSIIELIIKGKLKSLKVEFARKEMQPILFLSCLVLVFIAGIIIPASLMSSSPQEFIKFTGVEKNPLWILPGTFWKAFSGLFFLPVVLYFLFKDNVKYFITVLFTSLALIVPINVFLFAGNYGTISENLHFDNPTLLKSSLSFSGLNILVLIFCFVAVVFLLYKKYYRVISTVYMIMLLTFVPMTIKYATEINKEYSRYTKMNSDSSDKNEISQIFSLSKTKQNVVVLMLDRAINSFFPILLDYYPQLREQFGGFTYYPNTISFNDRTLMGAISVFGGYEYTPTQMNKRSDIPLKDKQHEGLKMLPKIFQNAGYNSVFTDPPYAGYSWIPDVSVLTDDGIGCELLEARYTNLWLKEKRPEQKSSGKVDLMSFSFFRMFPVIIREAFYNDGNYMGTGSINIDTKFLNGFSVLDYLPQLFSYDSDKGGCMIIYNGTTHEPVFLPNDSYIVPGAIDESDIRTDYKLPFNDKNTLCHFYTNLVALKRVGIWLDTLREKGVYDNTKIIIVADHGREDLCTVPFGGKSFQAKYHPLLLMKDFDSTKEIVTDNSFMTNADVPALAVSHLPDDLQKNPYTGKNINMDEKENGVDIVVRHNWEKDMVPGKTTYTYREEDLVHVHTNIFDEKNWSKLH